MYDFFPGFAARVDVPEVRRVDKGLGTYDSKFASKSEVAGGIVLVVAVIEMWQLMVYTGKDVGKLANNALPVLGVGINAFLDGSGNKLDEFKALEFVGNMLDVTWVKLGRDGIAILG